MRTKHYSDYLNQVAGLIGIAVSDLQTPELTILNGFFNKGMRQIWQQGAWVDVCPSGEARFVGNAVPYAKDLSQWVTINATTTPNVIINPLDGQMTGGQFLETVASGVHAVRPASLTTLGSTVYRIAFYVRGIGRNWCFFIFQDAAATQSTAWLNLSTGTVGTTNGCTPSIVQAGDGWYLVSCLITTGSTTGLSSLTIASATADNTSSLAGSTSAGLYVWGATVTPMQNVVPSDALIPWEQPGEQAIDVVYEVYGNPPMGSSLPRRAGYQLIDQGVQLINSSGGYSDVYYLQNALMPASQLNIPLLSPAFLYYRKRVPYYNGNTFDATLTYSVGTQVYYTNTNGDSDYYACTTATTAGQSPDTTPASWTVQSIPYVFFDYAVYSSFADWLRTEGQLGKAMAMDGFAQDLMDREADRQERQMGTLPPMRVFTHLTSRPTLTR